MVAESDELQGIQDDAKRVYLGLKQYSANTTRHPGPGTTLLAGIELLQPS